MRDFKVGDRVVVTNPGETYSTYEKFVKRYASDYLDLFKTGKIPNNNDLGIIVALVTHNYRNEGLALVLINETVFVIGTDGIKLLKPREPRYTISEIRENPSLIKDIVLENVKKALEDKQ